MKFTLKYQLTPCTNLERSKDLPLASNADRDILPGFGKNDSHFRIQVWLTLLINHCEILGYSQVGKESTFMPVKETEGLMYVLSLYAKLWSRFRVLPNLPAQTSRIKNLIKSLNPRLHIYRCINNF